MEASISYAGTSTTEQTVPLLHGGDGGQRRKKLRVMVAIDESDSSFYALTWTLDHLFMNAPSGTAAEGGEEAGMVTVVHVTKPFQHFVYPAGGAPSFANAAVVMESVKKSQEESSAAILSRALLICKDRMVKAETQVLNGDPKDMICQAAEKMNVDLLVVGSRDLGMVKRALLGSVSNHCAHHASCPVMIVRPPRGSGQKARCLHHQQIK